MVVAALLLAMAPTPALAQAIAAAEALFRDGKALANAGDYARACPKFMESLRLDPSAGTALNVALCHQNEGKTATAWADYLVAGRIANQQSKPAVTKEAQSRATELERQLSYLTVRVQEPVVGLSISRDGMALASGSLDTKIPVDPGPHVVQARAPGYRTFEMTVTLAPARDDKVVLIPQLKRESPESASATGGEHPGTGAQDSVHAQDSAQGSDASGTASPAKEAGSGAAQPTGAPERGASISNAAIAGWALSGVGVIGIATGSVFGLRVRAKVDDSAAICPTGLGCTTDEKAAYDATLSDARQARTVALAGVGLGGAALAAGITLLLWPQSQPLGVRLAPQVTGGATGVIAQGAW